MSERIGSAVDKFLEKIISRKLLVWLTTTTLLVLGLVGVDAFLAISAVYLGMQGVADVIAKVKGKGGR